MNSVKKYWLSLKFRPFIKALVVGLVVAFILMYIVHPLLGDNEDGWSNAYYILLAAGTGLIAWVAWIELSHLENIGQNDFLLRIDDRYGSKEIVEARTIIHKLSLDAPEIEICYDSHVDAIGQKIKEMEINKKSPKKFVYLLNFLDFLETIAYFVKKEALKSEDLEELLGESLTYYYDIFCPLICSRREKHKKNSYYRELENLALKIKKS